MTWFTTLTMPSGGIPTLRIEALLWDQDGWPQSPSALLGQEIRKCAAFYFNAQGRIDFA